MNGVLSDAVCSVNAVLGVKVLQRRQQGANDFLSSSHYPVHFMSVVFCAVSKSGRDAVSENALNGTAVKDGHGWSGGVRLL